MKFKFFTVPLFDCVEAENDLNSFLASHRVLSVDSHFVSNDSNNCWAICVRYTTGEPVAFPLKKGKIDYREVLSDTEFALFANLRQLRKKIADQEAVPPYALFTNDQLAEMVRRQVKTRADMEKIQGVGPARIEKYAEAFLSVLQSAPPTAKEEGGDVD